MGDAQRPDEHSAAPSTRRVDSLVGIYNADAGVLGELRYVVRRAIGRGHCSLCDLTHRGVRRRGDWVRASEDRCVPIELLHRNERTPEVERASGDRVPCVLARVNGDLVGLLGPADLEGCRGDVDEFDRRLRLAAADEDLVLEAD